MTSRVLKKTHLTGYWKSFFVCFPEGGTMAEVSGFSLPSLLISGLALSATLGSTHRELAAEWV